MVPRAGLSNDSPASSHHSPTCLIHRAYPEWLHFQAKWTHKSQMDTHLQATSSPFGETSGCGGCDTNTTCCLISLYPVLPSPQVTPRANVLTCNTLGMPRCKGLSVPAQSSIFTVVANYVESEIGWSSHVGSCEVATVVRTRVEGLTVSFGNHCYCCYL